VVAISNSRPTFITLQHSTWDLGLLAEFALQLVAISGSCPTFFNLKHIISINHSTWGLGLLAELALHRWWPSLRVPVLPYPGLQGLLPSYVQQGTREVVDMYTRRGTHM